MIKVMQLKKPYVFSKSVEGKERLNRMLSLRVGGMSLQELANLFGTSVHTVARKCSDHGVKPAIPIPRKRRIDYKPPVPPAEHKYAHILFEEICRGKNYDDYIKDAQDRGEKVEKHTDWGAGD